MKHIICLILILLVLSACSVDNSKQEATAKSAYGFLRLSGNMSNREAYIAGNQLGIDPEDDANTFRLKSGVHHLEIRSKNRILLSEDLLISTGQTVEITVP